MDFRRNPFLFKANNPADRRAELMRRFGVSDPENKTMIVDPPTMNGYGHLSTPGFEPMSSSLFSDKNQRMKNNHVVDPGTHTPCVRVIPIQIEGENMNTEKSQKDQGFSRSHSDSKVPTAKPSELKNKMENHSSCSVNVPITLENKKMPQNPQVRNVPIAVEKRDCPCTEQKPVNSKKKETQRIVKPNEPKQSFNSKPKKTEAQKPTIFQQIDAVMQEFQMFKGYAENFEGKEADKEYRYLDEMLLHCILKLDNIEVGNNKDARMARKAAVKDVQNCIDQLEAKVCQNSASNTHNAVLSIEQDHDDGGQQESLNVIPELGKPGGEVGQDFQMDSEPSSTSVETVGQPQEAKIAGLTQVPNCDTKDTLLGGDGSKTVDGPENLAVIDSSDVLQKHNEVDS